MLRRVSQMAFAPSTMVFPAAASTTATAMTGAAVGGPSPAQWGARLGCSPADAQLFVAAAIREVFEECGVLLAGPSSDGTPCAEVEAERWRGVRDALIAREVSLGEVLRDKGLVLRWTSSSPRLIGSLPSSSPAASTHGSLRRTCRVIRRPTVTRARPTTPPG